MDQSTVTGSSTIDASQVASTIQGEQDKDERNRRFFVGFLLCCCALAVIAPLLLTLARKSGGDEVTEARTEVYGLGSPGSGVPSSKESHKPSTIASESGVSATASDVVPKNIFFCTIDATVTWFYALEDGVCDYIFFDAVYGTVDPERRIDPQDIYGQLFAEMAENYSLTTFGLGFEDRAIKYFEDDMANEEYFNTSFYKMWTAKTANIGLLNVHELDMDDEFLDEALTFLKWLKDYLNGKKGHTVGITAFGFFSDPRTACEYVGDSFNTKFEPDIIITLGHMSFYTGERRDCVTTPVIYDVDPRKLLADYSYGHTLTEAVDLAKCTQRVVKKATVAVAVTICRLYFSTWDYRILVPCSSLDPGYWIVWKSSIDKICWRAKPGTYNISYDARVNSWVYQTSDRLIDVFDNELTLRQKVCSAMRNYTDVNLKFAVYSTNCDYMPNHVCPEIVEGNNSRIRLMRWLISYIEDFFKSPSDYNNCLNWEIPDVPNANKKTNSS